MAKTKPQDRARRSKKGTKNKANGDTKKAKQSPAQLLLQATELLQTSQPEDALVPAQRALGLLQGTGEPTLPCLPALSILGEICVELGDIEAARDYFTTAAQLDPDGSVAEEAGGGADKFLWLAQLSEEGGASSVAWFEKGALALRRDLGVLEGQAQPTAETAAEVEDKKRKLANALCGSVEVYMTDLSWEAEAEARCEALVTEALLVTPDSAEVLQTLANVRISQSKMDEARSALSRSLALWRDLEPDAEDGRVPDFATRISLARLLIEAEMRDEAMEVLERLVGEDDSSVEAWYLGGWCLYLGAAAATTTTTTNSNAATTIMTAQQTSREWLQNSLKMYAALDYEDSRLGEHARELVAELDAVLGPANNNEAEDGDEGAEGDGDGDESDEEMEGT